MAKRTTTHHSPARFNARMLPGAQPAPFPGFIKPQLATLKDSVPAGAGWLHEIKFEPSLLADVAYRTITTAGLLRHAVWKGLK